MKEHTQRKSSPGKIALKKDVLWKGATAVFSIPFVISFFTRGFGLGGDNVTDNIVNTPTADDDARIGNPDAPFEIIEFSDYQCPFCDRAESTVQQILDEYEDKVSLVYRDFPLNRIHPYAQKAAEAAECAGEQGKYYEMHDILFENQNALGVEDLKSYAVKIGLNSDEFNDCLDSGKMASEISKDLADGQAVGIRGTPAFFINGKLVSGAQPFSVFKQAIGAELS